LDELQTVRAQCLDVHDLISSATDALHAERRSLNKQRKTAMARFRQGGPHSTIEQQQYFKLGRAVHRSLIPITDLMYENVAKRSARLIEILEPEVLDSATKLTYANQMLTDLRAIEREYLAKLKESIERLAFEVIRLKEFVDARHPPEEGDSMPKLVATVDGAGSELDQIDPEYVYDSRDEERPDFEYRDEFLDSPEYRRIAKSLLESILTPLEAFRPTLTELQATFERQFARVSEWQSSRPHEVEQSRWISEHMKELSALTKSMTALIEQSSEERKRENRALRVSLDSDDDSAVDALRKYHDSLKVQIDQVLPVLLQDVEIAIAKGNDVICYLESNGEGGSKKRARRMWGRKGR